jgi:DNA damage-inducible protein 1
MKISIMTLDGNISVIELPDNESFDILTQIIAAEVGIPINELIINHYGTQYSTRNFHTLSLNNEDIISIDRLRAKRIGIHDLPAAITPEELLRITSENPHLITQFESNDVDMANAIKSNDPKQIRVVMMTRQLAQHKVIFDQREEEAQIFSDPMSEESQRKIEEKIRQQNIQSSMETAIEEIPESFGVVQMLYIRIEVNGLPLQAFVDSGAQSTIMSAACVERCGLSRLIDRRFAGQARGVGTAPILGRIHLAQMKIQNSYFPISITVLQGGDIDFLFGLDMLRRHQCCIDLKQNLLRIEGGTTVEECPFLSEDQITRHSAAAASPPPDAHAHPISSSAILLSPKRPRAGSSLSEHDPFEESLIESLRQSGEFGIPHQGRTSPLDPNEPTRRSESGHFVNSDVIHLCSLGFSIIEASNALSQAEGNVELAAQLLFSSRT